MVKLDKTTTSEVLSIYLYFIFLLNKKQISFSSLIYPHSYDFTQKNFFHFSLC